MRSSTRSPVALAPPRDADLHLEVGDLERRLAWCECARGMMVAPHREDVRRERFVHIANQRVRAATRGTGQKCIIAKIVFQYSCAALHELHLGSERRIARELTTLRKRGDDVVCFLVPHRESKRPYLRRE